MAISPAISAMTTRGHHADGNGGGKHQKLEWSRINQGRAMAIPSASGGAAANEGLERKRAP